MLQLDNRTSWSAGLYPGWSRDRNRQQTMIIKVGYRFDALGRLTPLPQPPIVEADEYAGKPETSSLVAASETAPFKQGGEILLYGSAHPRGTETRGMTVGLSLRQGDKNYWHKDLQVFGPRSWKRKLTGSLPGTPEPLTEPVPLMYENAFGGADPSHPERIYGANPAGVGYSLRGLRTQKLTLPQIELSSHPITSPASRVQPAGFGPLAPHWEPRYNEAVEIDQEAIAYGGCPWAKEPPESLFNAAPLDQRFDQPFSGEMTLNLKGLVAEAPDDHTLINLPLPRPLVKWEADNVTHQQRPQCDTLIIDTDKQELYLLFRVGCHDDIIKVAFVTAELHDPDAEEEGEEAKQTDSLEVTS